MSKLSITWMTVFKTQVWKRYMYKTTDSSRESVHKIVCTEPHMSSFNWLLFTVKLQPAIFPLSQHVIRFHELPADTTQRFLQ